jgi:hypothetical protein
VPALVPCGLEACGDGIAIEAASLEFLVGRGVSYDAGVVGVLALEQRSSRRTAHR